MIASDVEAAEAKALIYFFSVDGMVLLVAFAGQPLRGVPFEGIYLGLFASPLCWSYCRRESKTGNSCER